VAGAVPDGIKVKGVRDLSLESSPLEWLRTPTNWGTLADAAKYVARRSTDELSRYSPLQLRFMVALQALDAAPWTASPADLSRRALSRSVADAFAADAEHAALRTLWTKLALVRLPFSPQLLARLGEPNLGQRARDLLHHCLLYGRDGNLVLHETLRRDALERGWLDHGALRNAHGVIASAYAETFANEPRFLDQLEAYHHATEAADDSLLSKLSPMFVEQLDALGRARSLAARRERNEQRRRALYDAAVETFRSSVRWDDTNAYAHHYLAFNLDVQGKGTTDIEQHYPRAIELEPRTAWWHSRWICYLITRGQARRAERAWDDALDALGLPQPGGGPAFVYEGLQLWVARLLLHRGRLDFAERVLKNVPADVRDTHVGLRALLRRLEVLLETRHRRAFLPGPLMRSDWWKHRPALLQLQDRGKLVRWLAARVDEVDLQERVLRLDGAQVSVGHDKEPELCSLEVPFAEFDKWNPDEPAKSLAAGRFLEIGVYVGGGNKGAQKRARVQPQRAWVDDDLPTIFPDPIRWLSNWPKPTT
jgi:tetratricopeptide (TPR) repeat protein